MLPLVFSGRVGGYQWLGLVTLLGVLSLIALGATVRVTDSGLACPDWPLCNGRIIPAGDYHVWIEWAHRLAASIIGLVILIFVVTTWVRYRDRPWVLWPVMAALVALGIQVVLGGLTVTEKLPAQIVTAHLGVALTIVMLLTLGLMASLIHLNNRVSDHLNRVSDSRNKLLVWLAVVTTGSTLSLILLGAYVSGTDAGFACSGWPLCNGSLLPEGRGTSVHIAHRYFAGFVGLLVLGLVVAVWIRYRRQRVFCALSLVIVVIYVAQVMVGAANIWTVLASGWRVAHVVLASLLWVSLIVLAALLAYQDGLIANTRKPHPLSSLLMCLRVKVEGRSSGD